MACRCCRPIANILNFLVPHLPLGSLNANTMFPDLQRDWDSGGRHMAH